MPRKPRPPSPHPAQAVHSYLLRVVEQRVVTVARVYELHDIATGRSRCFETLEAMQRFLARTRRAAG